MQKNQLVISMFIASACMAAVNNAFSAAGTLGPSSTVRVTKIPSDAEIVFHQDECIYVIDRNGKHRTQITFDKLPYPLEHVAISPDRRFMVVNTQAPNPSAAPGGKSSVWLFDLERGTRVQVLPDFVTTGNGGVDWDRKGFFYFAGKEGDVVATPRTPAEFKINAGANDIYKMKFDGSGLTRLTKTPDRGEADVSVSADGNLVTFMDVDVNADVTDIVMCKSDGSGLRTILRAGKPGVASVHDPEFSPDNSKVCFSMVNKKVPPNFPENPAANTAHDIWIADVKTGKFLRRVTKPGPISIAPDWANEAILYFEGNSREPFVGISTCNPEGVEQQPHRVEQGGTLAKWIPAK